MEYDTEFGKVKVEELIRVYGLWKNQITKANERRVEFLQTEEGKQWNRDNARRYYERHREEILARKKAKRDAMLALQD